MTDAEKEARIVSGQALFDSMGGFDVVSWDAAKKELIAAVTVRREFCHTNATIAQGGFVTAWLDAAMAHAVMYDTDHAQSVASLEIKVSFLEKCGPGPAGSWHASTGAARASLFSKRIFSRSKAGSPRKRRRRG